MIKTFLILATVILPLSFFGQNYKNRAVIGEDSARQIIKNIVSDSSLKLSSDTLIRDQETAIAVAEIMLFKM